MGSSEPQARETFYSHPFPELEEVVVGFALSVPRQEDDDVVVCFLL